MKILKGKELDCFDGQLDAREAAHLRQVTVQVSDSNATDMYTLIAGWHQHVEKMHADLELPDSDRTVWGAYDLLAALILRNFVARGIKRLRPKVAAVAQRIVGNADERFLSYTEKDDLGLVARIDDSIGVGHDWWWERIPTHGPIRREIEAIDARRARTGGQDDPGDGPRSK